MQDSQNKPKIGSKGSERKKRLILGGRTYTVDDDDISVISPTNDKAKSVDNKSKSSDKVFEEDNEVEKRYFLASQYINNWKYRFRIMFNYSI